LRKETTAYLWWQSLNKVVMEFQAHDRRGKREYRIRNLVQPSVVQRYDATLACCLWSRSVHPDGDRGNELINEGKGSRARRRLPLQFIGDQFYKSCNVGGNVVSVQSGPISTLVEYRVTLKGHGMLPTFVSKVSTALKVL
jgi:hypothetical protein